MLHFSWNSACLDDENYKYVNYLNNPTKLYSEQFFSV